MRYSDEFRDAAAVGRIVSRIGEYDGPAAAIMEVCGTHTMSAARFGLRSVLPPQVRLVSGPGCPVCVTDQRDIDSFLAVGRVPDVILASFGDMLRVPGSETSLERLRAAGTDVRVVYSPLDALEIARDNPGSKVVFFAVGFETTMPVTAIALKAADESGVSNFFVFCCHKTMPAALRALLTMGEVNLSGLLLPGHVTTIIGAGAYDFIAREFGIPCAVAGFEPVDMLLGIESILRQLRQGTACIDNAYRRAVRDTPNQAAAALLSEAFVPADAVWRGLGAIPNSGVEIAPAFARLDAKAHFADVIAAAESRQHVSADRRASRCKCGEVLRGVLAPTDCPLFGTACTPSDPVGPCMVSSEGACAAFFKYGGAT